jgi:LPXTG-site transpeptidase (sortase) family protein
MTGGGRQSPGCRRVIWIVPLLIAVVGVCLVVGVGSGLLAGKLALKPRSTDDRGVMVNMDRPVAYDQEEESPEFQPTPDLVAEGEAAAAQTFESPVAGGEGGAGEPSASVGPDPIEGEEGVTVAEAAPAPATEALPEDPSPQEEAPGLPAVEPATPATRLIIPSLGVDASVVLLPVRDGTWDVSALTQDVGHLQGTGSPGEGSNVALAGHVTLAQGGDGPFKDLATLQQGTDVDVYVGEQRYRYVVEGVRLVMPEDVDVVFPAGRAQLTLVTCANWDDEDGRYQERVVAVAYLAE